MTKREHSATGRTASRSSANIQSNHPKTPEGRRVRKAARDVHPLNIPDFLKVENRVERAMPDWIRNGTTATKPRLPPHLAAIANDWRLPKGVRDDPVGLQLYYDMQEEKRAKRMEGLVKLRDRPKPPPKPNPYAGKIHLRDILAGMSEHSVSLNTARKAVEARRLIHSKYHFHPDAVASVVQAITSYVPPKRGSALPERAVILVKTKKNPRKPNTGQFRRYAMILQHHGKTVAEYVKSGGHADALTYAVAGGHVKLEGGADASGAGRNEQPTVVGSGARAVSGSRGMHGSSTVENAERGVRDEQESVRRVLRQKKSDRGRGVEHAPRKAKRAGHARKPAKKRRGPAR